MKRVPHFQPPRQLVIYRYTRRMLDETAVNANTFAMTLAELYLGMTAPDVRTVPLRMGEGDELLKAMKNNAQIFRRFMDGTVKVLPADLEDAWVMALPDPYRGECERDLAARRNCYSMRMLPANDAAAAVNLGQLMTEVGQLCEALAPAVADGKICAKDLPHAQKILAESDDVIAAVLTLRKRITDLLAEARPHA